MAQGVVVSMSMSMSMSMTTQSAMNLYPTAGLSMTDFVAVLLARKRLLAIFVASTPACAEVGFFRMLSRQN